MFWLKYILYSVAIWAVVAGYIYYSDLKSMTLGGKGLGLLFFVYLATPVYVAGCALLGIAIKILRRSDD